tara:strand:- start:49 stop:459 length:411 start_codon:yes stop_codon:yes gene_type:complete
MSKKNTTLLQIKSQYIKDLSFENPLSPKIIPIDAVPQVNIEVTLNFLSLKNNDHELVLKIKSDAKFEDLIIYIVELQYGGIFNFNISDEKKKKEFIIEGAKILFPYSRSIIANVTRDGGYNPLMIQPFDFNKIYKD